MNEISTRESSAQALSALNDRIQRKLMQLRFSKVRSVLATHVDESKLPLSLAPAKHWFIPFDPNDWPWTSNNIVSVIDDERMRDFILRNEMNIRGFQNTNSFCWHHDTQPRNRHVYFIRALETDETEMKDACFHELMHGLLRQNGVTMPLFREEIATDAFSLLVQVSEGRDPAEALRGFMFRLHTNVPSYDYHNTLIVPYTYPSLAFVKELKEMASKITPNTSLQEMYEQASYFAQTCNGRRIEQWDQFCDKCTVMMREGESLAAIIVAASESKEAAMRQFGQSLRPLLPHTQKIKQTMPICNAFLEPKLLYEMHRVAQASAFAYAREEALREKSGRPFYAMAARQLEQLWQGRAFGNCADLLVYAGQAWDAAYSDPAKAADEAFDNHRKGTFWHDSFTPLDNLGRAYSYTGYRDDERYRNHTKQERIDIELKHAFNIAKGCGQAPMLLMAYIKLSEHYPDLLPDPLDVKNVPYMPDFHISRIQRV